VAPRSRVRWDRLRLRRSARDILAAALRAADPEILVRAHLRRNRDRLIVGGRTYPLGRGRLVLVAAGKAAGRMAHAAEGLLGERLDEALAVDTSATARLRRTRLLLARHPLPDDRGLRAAEEVERLARSLDRQDLLLLLISGGASALLPAPVPGVSLEDKAVATALLMGAGADIHELNTVRKHLSRLKGGGLARAAAPARVVTLVLSDVVGDDLSTIASGPTQADPTTYADALAILGRRGLLGQVPPSVREHLERGRAGEVAETPKPGDAVFARVATRVIGSNAISVGAAAREARRQGLRPLVLTTRLEGEAREVSRALTAVLRECVETARPAAAPVCLLAGGETTVTVRGAGTGGRNQELALASAPALAGFPVPAVVASLATDGIDGKSTAAGGLVDETSVARAQELGLAPVAAFLAESDSGSFLASLGDLIVTGPTGTNVVDVTALLAGEPPRRGGRARV
jgi:glycerate 2-kinase